LKRSYVSLPVTIVMVAIAGAAPVAAGIPDGVLDADPELVDGTRWSDVSDTITTVRCSLANHGEESLLLDADSPITTPRPSTTWRALPTGDLGAFGYRGEKSCRRYSAVKPGPFA
jgi:hypothetical protein